MKRVFGLTFQVPTGKQEPSSDRENMQDRGADEDEYKLLPDEGSSSAEPKPSPIIGYMLTAGLALLSSMITIVTGVASKAVALPHYTENFIRCLSASIVLFFYCMFSGDKLIQDFKTMRSALWLAIADWFFLWGYVKSMSYLNATEFSATSVSMTPVLSVALGFLLLSEKTSAIKLIGMIRNLVVVIAVIDPFGFFRSSKSSANTSDAADPYAMALGFTWGLVACCGTVLMRIIQRSLVGVSSSMTSFWCFAVNTLLWFPPGSVPPEIRLPFLWPKTPDDVVHLAAIPASVWGCAIASGCLGGIVIAVQAVTLRYIDVGTYSTLVAPMCLIFSFIVDCLMQQSLQPPRVMCGILLAVVGIVIEAVMLDQKKGVAPRATK
eukprot:TRINITY_DN2602_c0_g1_i1.p1 TRINITY_DN2602_c0_g1~~TRINITY_DN2602_c0_g1_i1.p1  ORF type:complete len:379 (-),score=44.11 TRINITY_DN2602_c0_g1_i1:309-1445(-)